MAEPNSPIWAVKPMVVKVASWRWLVTAEEGGGEMVFVVMAAVAVPLLQSCGGDGGDGHEGGVIVAAVGRQPEEMEARGGEWIWGSGRSGHGDNIWFRPERSPENFSGGGGMVAGGGGRREGWPDFWGRWRRERESYKKSIDSENIKGESVDAWDPSEVLSIRGSHNSRDSISLKEASKEAVWIMKFIYGLGVVPTNEEPVKMYCDNTGDITIANEP
ncbi:hypothetical protein Tco_0660133 [Tanacetum coccineum]